MSPPLGWDLPAPPSGTVTVPASDTSSVAAAFFGEDIWFDIVSAAFPDLVVTVAGDWQSVSGIAALTQAVIRRIVTAPGEWQTLPNYGAGARKFVKGKNTAATRSQLAAAIKAQLAQDPRIDTVNTVQVQPLDGAPGVFITVQFTPAGRLLNSNKPVVTVSFPVDG